MPIKAQSVIIIPGRSTDTGLVQSVTALAQALRNAKTTFAIFSGQTPVEEYSQFPLFDSRTSRDLSVNLTKVEDKVSAVNWKQIDQTVEIRLSSDNGNLGNPEVEIVGNNSDFDYRIFVGLNKEEAKLIDIAEDGQTDDQNSVFLTEQEEEVIPVLVFNFLKKNKFRIDEHIALNLLEGLYKATENFTKNQSAEGFFVASKLMTLIQKKLPNVAKPEKEQAVIPTFKAEQVQPNPNPKPLQETTVNKNPGVNDNPSNEEVTKTHEKPVLEEENQTTQPVQHTKEPAESIPVVSEPIIEIKEPEVLPADFDPLALASEVPQPLVLEKDKPQPKPVDNSPLPAAQ